MTRYTKKMVRPEFYGKVYIKGIDDYLISDIKLI